MNKTAIASGTTFVLAWVTGLLIAGGGPEPDASAADVASYLEAVASGLAAAVISLGQAAIGEAMAITAGHGSVSAVHGLFTALNEADTIKIVLLAVMIAATGVVAHRRGLPARLTWASLIFAPVLVVSGLAFPLGRTGLYALLYLTLPLLLIWVAAFTIVIARRNLALPARQASTLPG
jgi:hypothetical protein